MRPPIRTRSNRRWAAMPAGLLAISLGGCEEDTYELIEDDRDWGGATVCPGDPDIDVSPGEVATTVEVSAEAPTKAELITISNVGISDLHLERILLGSERTDIELSAVSSVLINPEGSSQFIVSFRPTSAEPIEGDIYIESDDPDEPVVVVPLSATVIAPELSLHVADDAWADVPLGCSGTDTVVAQNIGTVDLEIDTIALEGTGASLLDELPGTVTLAPGAELSLEVDWEPESTEAHEVIFTAWSSDPFSETRELTLELSPSLDERVETFTIGETLPTDIVVAMDASGSMAAFYDRVVVELATFSETVATSDADFRILLPTVQEEGCLGDAGVVQQTGEPADEAQALWAMVPHEVTPELNLERTLMGFASWMELTQAGECNEGMLREGAVLQLLSFSDELDQSVDPAASLLEVQGYVDQPDHVVINSVSGLLPSGCEDAETGQEVMANTTLAPLIEETGGLHLSLCDAPWGEELAAVVDTPARMAGSVPLAAAPVDGTLVVSLEGTELSEETWSHDTDHNEVVLSSSAGAEEGDEVVIGYVAQSECPEES